MQYFKWVRSISIGAFIGRFLYFIFKRWVIHIPATDSPNGFDADSLPLVGIIRYVDYDLYWDEDEIPDPNAFDEWFVFEPDWLWWIRTDIIYPVTSRIQGLLIKVGLLPPLQGGFLVPSDFAEELLKSISYQATPAVNTTPLVWDGESDETNGEKR